MNNKSLIRLVAAVIMGASATLGMSNNAQAQSSGDLFVCNPSSNQGVPATMVKKSGSSPVPLIYWRTNFPQWPKLKRCQEVTRRLNKFQKEDKLGNFTTGKIRGNNVICVTSKEGGKCDGLLYSIPRDRNPQEALDELLEAIDLSSGAINNVGEIVKEVNGQRYININRLLEAVE